jgi:hypothetical protein
LENFPRKELRAKVIKKYVDNAGLPGCVCFSCGNATKALKETGLYTVDISPCGDLSPSSKWWEVSEIRKAFPNLFDATSGHLPIPLMVDIAHEYKQYLGELPAGAYNIPSGSGETILCLKIAYPECTFRAIYDNSTIGTAYDYQNKINSIISSFFDVEIL